MGRGKSNSCVGGKKKKGILKKKVVKTITTGWTYRWRPEWTHAAPQLADILHRIDSDGSDSEWTDSDWSGESDAPDAGPPPRTPPKNSSAAGLSATAANPTGGNGRRSGGVIRSKKAPIAASLGEADSDLDCEDYAAQTARVKAPQKAPELAAKSDSGSDSDDSW